MAWGHVPLLWDSSDQGQLQTFFRALSVGLAQDRHPNNSLHE